MKPSISTMVWMALALGTVLQGCGARESGGTAAFRMALRSTDDLDRAIEGVSWTADGKALGVSDGHGEVRTSLDGTEGQSVKLYATCPKGYRASPAMSVMRLKQARGLLNGSEQPMKKEVTCVRETTDVVLAVHAPGGANLPIRVGGRAAGQTDENGVAHVLIPTSRTERRIDVTLDTSCRPEVRPANPTRSFELHQRDAVLVFDQTLSTLKKVRKVRERIAAKPMPVRID